MQTWDSGFQARIDLTNDSSSETSWSVRLTYPSAVTALASTWIESYGAQPVLTDTALPDITLSSSGPLAPGATIRLFVQLDKTGTSFEPSLRTVNGSAF